MYYECLFPFLPLFADGKNFIDGAKKRIYQASLPRQSKADLFTGMAILGGLISEEIPLKETFFSFRKMGTDPSCCTHFVEICLFAKVPIKEL